MPEVRIAIATHRHETQSVPGLQKVVGRHEAAERLIEHRPGKDAIWTATKLERHEASEVVDRREDSAVRDLVATAVSGLQCRGVVVEFAVGVDLVSNCEIGCDGRIDLESRAFHAKRFKNP